MLRFPVSLLTATAFSHAIRHTLPHRLSHWKRVSEKGVEHPDCSCVCHMKTAVPGGFPQNIVLEQPDAELRILRSTRAVLEDIRVVLGISAVLSIHS